MIREVIEALLLLLNPCGEDKGILRRVDPHELGDFDGVRLGARLDARERRLWRRVLPAQATPHARFRVFSRICGSLSAPVADPTYGTARFLSNGTTETHTPFWW